MNEVYGKWEEHKCCKECNTKLKGDETQGIYHCPYCGYHEGGHRYYVNRPRRPVYAVRKLFGFIPWKTFLRYEHRPEDKGLQSRG